MHMHANTHIGHCHMTSIHLYKPFLTCRLSLDKTLNSFFLISISMTHTIRKWRVTLLQANPWLLDLRLLYRADKHFKLLPFFWTSWGVGILNSAIFNSFHNWVEFGTILEGLQNFWGGLNRPPSSEHHWFREPRLHLLLWALRVSEEVFIISHFVWQFLTHKPMLMICTNYAEIYWMSTVLPQIPDGMFDRRHNLNLSPKWHSTSLHGWFCRLSTFSPVWPLERQPEYSLSSSAYPKSESKKTHSKVKVLSVAMSLKVTESHSEHFKCFWYSFPEFQAKLNATVMILKII